MIAKLIENNEKKKNFTLFKDDTAIIFGLLDIKLKQHWIAFVVQALFAGIFIGASLCLLELLFEYIEIITSTENNSKTYVRTLVIGSIAASTFLVFGAPHLGSSKPKNIILGHFISASFGIVVLWVCSSLGGSTNQGSGLVISGLASVALSSLSMTALNLEHPPAAGTALAIATHNVQNSEFIFEGYKDPYPLIILIFLFVIIVTGLLSLIRLFLYYDNDHLDSIEGLGKEVQRELAIKGVTNVSELCGGNKNLDRCEVAIIKDILRGKDLCECYGLNKDKNIAKNEAEIIAHRWIHLGNKVLSDNKKYSHHVLRDLF